jgi:hypothetical protein
VVHSGDYLWSSGPTGGTAPSPCVLLKGAPWPRGGVARSADVERVAEVDHLAFGDAHAVRLRLGASKTTAAGQERLLGRLWTSSR